MILKTKLIKLQNTPEPRRVLVVDNNHSTVVAVSLMLEALAFRVDAANCGAAALNCLGRRKYDVVLTNLEMPEIKGDALVLKIKEKWPGTGVIIMTGRSSDEMEVYGGNPAIENWISKPFDLAVLAMTLNKITPLNSNGSQ